MESQIQNRFLKTSKPADKQNIIIITQLGLEKLGNSNDWNQLDDASQKFENETVCSRLLKCKLQSSLSFNRTFKQTSQIRDELVHSILNRGEHFSRKAVSKHEKWKGQQENSTQEIKRQLKKLYNQKYRTYEWPQISSHYKQNISQILNRWQKQKISYKSRIKERLSKIYREKYEKAEGQKSNAKVSRSFHEPKLSKIYMEGNKQNIEKEAGKSKIYHKLAKTHNKFVQ